MAAYSPIQNYSLKQQETCSHIPSKIQRKNKKKFLKTIFLVGVCLDRSQSQTRPSNQLSDSLIPMIKAVSLASYSLRVVGFLVVISSRVIFLVVGGISNRVGSSRMIRNRARYSLN
jgi:hypothetical protein